MNLKTTFTACGIAVALLACTAGDSRAHGFGGGGRLRVYTATGPATRQFGPATQFYGGYDNAGLAIAQPAPAYAHQRVQMVYAGHQPARISHRTHRRAR